jgi:hypothetical protein
MRDIPLALTSLAALYGQSGAAAAQMHQLRCQG